MVPITYREFWDVPRVFLASYKGQTFLFDCRFDESEEDFKDHYEVHLMQALSPEDLSGDWQHLSERAKRHLGPAPIRNVVFDPTRRKAIDPRILDLLLEEVKGTRSVNALP